MTKAVYVTKEGAALKDAPPVPTPSEGQVLIKNVVVASNPKGVCCVLGWDAAFLFLSEWMCSTWKCGALIVLVLVRAFAWSGTFAQTGSWQSGACLKVLREMMLRVT